jgi:hypothetical protein
MTSAKASAKAEAGPSLRLRMTRQKQAKASAKAEADPSLRLRMTTYISGLQHLMPAGR